MFRNFVVSVICAFGFILGQSTTAHGQFRLSNDAADALAGVIAHEIGHAVLREFDLPILGPEEDIAEDFSVVFVHMMLPDRAEKIVRARALQHLADNRNVGRFSEYRDDDQRASRNICLLYGIDPEKYQDIAAEFNLSGDSAANCRDFPTEVARSWRRILQDYLIPSTARVTEVRTFVDAEPRTQAFAKTEGYRDSLYMLRSIDWHSSIQLAIIQCDGTASWSRSRRTISLCSEYIERFQDQLGR